MLHDATSFDRNLQMFRERPRAISLAHLHFLRWLVEHGRLEPPVGRPTGEYAEAALADTVREAQQPIARD
jgi:hypothetical protein